MHRKFLVLLLLPSLVFSGGVKNEMEKFYRAVGGSFHENRAAIVQGQQAGYATGGSFRLRNRVMKSNLVQVKLPKFTTGCGGIDIYNGGFSFINKEELVNHLKSIASSSIGFAFKLGVANLTPSIANAMADIEDKANWANSLSINSCEAAANLVGAAWPKNTEASQHICRVVGEGNTFSDYTARRHSCGKHAEYSEHVKQLEKDEPDILSENFNIAWKVLEKYTSLDQELKELFMSITGTIVYRMDEDEKNRKEFRNKIEVYPSMLLASKGEDEKSKYFLEAFLEGGKTNMYSCGKGRIGKFLGSHSDKKCLFVRLSEKEIKPEDSWHERIFSLLKSIEQKIREDIKPNPSPGFDDLSQEEIDLISSNEIPVFQYIATSVAFNKNHTVSEMNALATLISLDLLCQYVNEVLDLCLVSSKQLKEAQLFDENLDDYLNDLREVRKRLKQFKHLKQNFGSNLKNINSHCDFMYKKVVSEISLD